MTNFTIIYKHISLTYTLYFHFVCITMLGILVTSLQVHCVLKCAAVKMSLQHTKILDSYKYWNVRIVIKGVTSNTHTRVLDGIYSQHCKWGTWWIINQFKTITRLNFCDRWWKHFSFGQFNNKCLSPHRLKINNWH